MCILCFLSTFLKEASYGSKILWLTSAWKAMVLLHSKFLFIQLFVLQMLMGLFFVFVFFLVFFQLHIILFSLLSFPSTLVFTPIPASLPQPSVHLYSAIVMLFVNTLHVFMGSWLLVSDSVSLWSGEESWFSINPPADSWTSALSSSLPCWEPHSHPNTSHTLSPSHSRECNQSCTISLLESERLSLRGCAHVWEEQEERIHFSVSQVFFIYCALLAWVMTKRYICLASAGHMNWKNSSADRVNMGLLDKVEKSQHQSLCDIRVLNMARISPSKIVYSLWPISLKSRIFWPDRKLK